MHPLQSDPHLIFLKCRLSHITTFPDKIQAPFLQKTFHDLPSYLSFHLPPDDQAPIASLPLLFSLPAWMALPASQPATSYPAFKAVCVPRPRSLLHPFLLAFGRWYPGLCFMLAPVTHSFLF